jgi:hypothetical protein
LGAEERLSRLDGKLTAAGSVPLELAELLAALGPQPEASLRDWREAIACYLSASDGWRDASQALGGAFASESADPQGPPDEEP